MPRMTLICRNATTFTPAGELDEEAFRRFLARLVESGLGFYIASGASGEGHALTAAELSRVYRIGVEVGGGKVPVNANPPEQNTAKAQLEHVRIAVEAGVDVVNIYGPASWHGYLPTDEEFLAYYDFILASVRHPVALAPNPIIGYTPKPQLIAAICRKYPQVAAVNLSGQGDTYFIELQDCLTKPVPIYVQVVGSLNLLGLGAAGLLGAEANILPETHRRYLDNYEAGRFQELAADYAEIRRFGHYVGRWNTSSPRWLKMAMRALKLPGGEGGPRPPYLPAPEPEYRRFVDGLLRLRIREIDDLARAAGLSLPAEAAA